MRLLDAGGLEVLDDRRAKVLRLEVRGRALGDAVDELVVLLVVTPPRTGERTLVAVENLLGSIALPEPFALEIAGDADGVSVLTRCGERSLARQQLEAYYPQARIAELSDDPSHRHRSRHARARAHLHISLAARIEIPALRAGMTSGSVAHVLASWRSMR